MEDFASLTPAQQEAFLTCPALAHPPGPRPNLDDPPNGNGQGLAIIVVCDILSTSWAVIRAYSSVLYSKNVIPDHLLDLGLLAFGVYIGVLISISQTLHNIGLFVHQWYIQVEQMERFLLVSVHQGASRAIYADLRQLHFLYMTFYCLRMMNRRFLDVFFAVSDFAFDLFILVLPQRVIRGLHLLTRRNISISVVFSTGVILRLCADRVHSTATIDFFGDRTSFPKNTTMWALGQNLAVLLVFRVAGAPKAFGSCGMLKHAVRRSWPAQNFHSSASSGSYPRMNRDCEATPTELRLMEPQRTYAAHGGHQRRDLYGDGILWVTKITTRVKGASA
ncbi:hypothetical protein DL764_009622 [Monosporascus ibericus]|uniref:Integral membrane protein n=1 Tax=Monosporascus ibericus TaxID=155417 RepID=A0A4Q4SUH2_9PEZI|nr:hypothetical protein DL764_009622 [Monosporascus ibericus]